MLGAMSSRKESLWYAYLDVCWPCPVSIFYSIYRACTQVSFNNKMFDGPVSALTVAGVGVKSDKVGAALGASVTTSIDMMCMHVACASPSSLLSFLFSHSLSFLFTDFCLSRAENCGYFKER